jgi:beta-xylosidase
MRALEDFDVTVTFCFTPEHRGIGAHHTSPPFVPEEFAAFCSEMVERYAPRQTERPARGGSRSAVRPLALETSPTFGSR